MHLARALVETILRAGEVSAGDFADVDRHAEVLEQFTTADCRRLVTAADAAHSLREEDHTSAFTDDAGDFLDGIDVRREVLFGNDLEQTEDERQMRAEKLVVPRHKAQRIRQQHRARIDIVQTRRVVAHHDIRSLLLARIILNLDLYAEFFEIEQLPKIAQRAIDRFRRFAELARMELFCECLLRVCHVVCPSRCDLFHP